MSWAGRRRTTYLGIVIAGLLIVVGIPAFFYFYEPPTCFDGVKNGSESGIDCGGGCALLCIEEVRAPRILWARTFLVTDGVYNVVAYVENSNSEAIAEDVPYTFKLFDSENVLIAERKGMTTLSRQGIIPIFEGSLVAGNRIPARAFFEFSGPLSWSKFSDRPSFSVEGVVLSHEGTAPRIVARLVNNDVATYSDVEVVATVFDTVGNALASSRTVVSALPGRNSVPLVFTWPEPFTATSSQIDVIPRVIR